MNKKVNYALLDMSNVDQNFNIENIYSESNKHVDIKEIFESYGIPKSFQKVLIKISKSNFSNRNIVEEYTMGQKFNISLEETEKLNDKIVSYEDVIYFIRLINNNGYLKPYLKAIKEIIGVSLNLDLIFKCYDESNGNSKYALKMYRKQKRNFHK